MESILPQISIASNPELAGQLNDLLQRFYTDIYNLLAETQTLEGVKTFGSFPVTPSSAPSSDYQVTNKKYVVDNFTINTAIDISGKSWVIDEDTMASDDAGKVPTQQSVKAYANQIGYVDRGDPSAWDWEVGDFTTDGTWRDLDCSPIVNNSNAIAIRFVLYLLDDAVTSAFLLRKNGNSNLNVFDGRYTQVANVPLIANLIVACDGNQVVEYWGSNLAFTTLGLTVAGWWLKI